MRAKLRKPLTLEIAHNIDQAQARLDSILKAWRTQELAAAAGDRDAAALTRLLFQIQIEQWHIVQEQLRLIRIGA
jgi:hypothetical protein